jgi:hypothetical protein
VRPRNDEEDEDEEEAAAAPAKVLVVVSFAGLVDDGESGAEGGSRQAEWSLRRVSATLPSELAGKGTRGAAAAADALETGEQGLTFDCGLMIAGPTTPSLSPERFRVAAVCSKSSPGEKSVSPACRKEQRGRAVAVDVILLVDVVGNIGDVVVVVMMMMLVPLAKWLAGAWWGCSNDETGQRHSGLHLTAGGNHGFQHEYTLKFPTARVVAVHTGSTIMPIAVVPLMMVKMMRIRMLQML